VRIFAKIVISLLFCFYLFVLTYRILFKYLPPTILISNLHFTEMFDYTGINWQDHNFIPFKTIIYYLFLADINLDIRVTNLAGNIIGFVPFGFMLPILIKRFNNLTVIIIATFTLSLTYELFQLLFRYGTFDIDDLILNILGGVLGYIPFRIIINLKKKYLTKSASL